MTPSVVAAIEESNGLAGPFPPHTAPPGTRPTYRPTCDLRWCAEGVLQQRWTTDTQGSSEWRKVPTWRGGARYP